MLGKCNSQTFPRMQNETADHYEQSFYNNFHDYFDNLQRIKVILNCLKLETSFSPTAYVPI